MRVKECSDYSRFQVTFQRPVAKFVLNIPNYITNLEYCVQLAKQNLQVAELSNEIPN